MNSQIRDMYQSLCQIINKEIELYENMIREMKNKQRAIIDGKIDNMKEAVLRERDISQRVMTHVKKRIALSQSIKTAVGIQQEDITLKQLIPHAELDHAAMLDKLQYQLKSSVYQISIINQENKYLLSASIENIHGLVNLFLKDDSTEDIRYEETGMITRPSDEYRVLDFQI